MTRVEVIAAIRAGATTTSSIARRLNASSAEVSHVLYALSLMGRITTAPGPSKGNRPGSPGYRYAINPNWRPKNTECSPERRAQLSIAAKARAVKNPESEARRLAKARATWAAKRVQIPAWVKPSHQRTYRAIARVLDEETAAEWARKAKAGPGLRSRLPRSPHSGALTAEAL